MFGENNDSETDCNDDERLEMFRRFQLTNKVYDCFAKVFGGLDNKDPPMSKKSLVAVSAVETDGTITVFYLQH